MRASRPDEAARATQQDPPLSKSVQRQPSRAMPQIHASTADWSALALSISHDAVSEQLGDSLVLVHWSRARQGEWPAAIIVKR
jgi:hypothetical protein